MTQPAGAHVEIIEPDHEPGTGLLSMIVYVNGVDVGRLARAPKVDAGDGREKCTTITLTLVPSRVDMRGETERSTKGPIGFAAEA